MEPISALLILAGSHGAAALVKSLTGVDEAGQLSGELVRALAASESHIDERLDRIENSLDELLEQAYRMALRRGVRYLLDATAGHGSTRELDLGRARDAFVEATAAARGPLQQAVAERYLLLVLLGLGRRDAAPASLARVEEYATANAFDSLRTSEHSHDATTALMRRDTTVLGRLAGGDRRRRARYEVKQAALDSIGMSARLLAEMALVRQTLGLPTVSAPPVEPIVDDAVITVTVKQNRSGMTSVHYDYENAPGGPLVYWTFEAASPWPLRIGSLTVTMSPEPAQASALDPGLADRVRLAAEMGEPIRGHARVELRAPLPIPLTITSPAASDVSSYHIANREQVTVTMAAGQTLMHVPLWRSADDRCRLRLTPPHVTRILIEVTYRP
jgi:hypothetical protein